jgi:hypothetical protein
MRSGLPSLIRPGLSSLIRATPLPSKNETTYVPKFNRYGGPGSQLVDLRFGRDWHDYLACGLDYIIVTVDGRGTGFKGRQLRNPVKDNLGFYETVDQVAAAKWVFLSLSFESLFALLLTHCWRFPFFFFFFFFSVLLLLYLLAIGSQYEAVRPGTWG